MRLPPFIFWLVALGTIGLSTALAEPPAPAARFRVVVNAKSPAETLERKLVADAFLKKTVRWPDGQMIRPVDQRSTTATRIAFSDDVLDRSVFAVKSYWEQIIFSGRGVPPPELENDEAVVAYVAKHEGAIGYVSPSAEVSAVKVVVVR